MNIVHSHISDTISGRQRLMDRFFQALTTGSAWLVLVILGGIIVSLFTGGWQALVAFGPKFLVTDEWNPVTEQFGALVPIYGTLVSSLIALLIAVPMSFGIAVFLTEVAPGWMRRPIGTAVELLAAIPSIIYGMWGLFVFAPVMSQHVQPWLQARFGDTALIGALFQGAPLGIGMLPAGIILGIMIIPFITALMRDVFLTTPKFLKESAYGVGATHWEVVWNVVLPYTRVGAVGGIFLGLGRALGETMAVTFVIGNTHRLSASLFEPGNSIASTLANEFNEAVGDMHTSALIALGLVLFMITFVVLALAKLLLLGLESRDSAKS
ncbi:phosphate transporter permease subunit PstC [Sulfuricaulis limicola]|uniref:Phosphate transport system permease protein n=1 Tax=Sulfuricaulis limicola TaxID=1620215 RepID=A0A1B4XCW9_9GAMM|nr:phosphate ABC transporter permease subunit PstC [Sulfuricaulis limicola]BAV32659.1 phosphate transporter permease subunit PstC [Sulfuricaulis limicola]